MTIDPIGASGTTPVQYPSPYQAPAPPRVPADIADGTRATDTYGGIPLVMTAAAPRPDAPPPPPAVPAVGPVTASARLVGIDTYA